MSIKNLKPQAGKFKQGYYTLKNPSKYVGDPAKIIYRSGWERKFMEYCDAHPRILKWSSEPIAIPYYHPIENRQAKYYVDFWVREIRDNDQEFEYMVEIKPEAQTLKPVDPEVLAEEREKKLRDKKLLEAKKAKLKRRSTKKPEVKKKHEGQGAGARVSLKQRQAYNAAMRTYIINSAKFAAAKAFASNMGRSFVVLTEKSHIFKNLL
jgi:hypothetical protein